MLMIVHDGCNNGGIVMRPRLIVLSEKTKKQLLAIKSTTPLPETLAYGMQFHQEIKTNRPLQLGTHDLLIAAISYFLRLPSWEQESIVEAEMGTNGSTLAQP
jgi:hypothetical protein